MCVAAIIKTFVGEPLAHHQLDTVNNIRCYEHGSVLYDTLRRIKQLLAKTRKYLSRSLITAFAPQKIKVRYAVGHNSPFVSRCISVTSYFIMKKSLLTLFRYVWFNPILVIRKIILITVVLKPVKYIHSITQHLRDLAIPWAPQEPL
jgi:hypothetical protein